LLPDASGVLIDLMVVVHRPQRELASFVESIWHHDGSQITQRRERVLPNGRFQIGINLASGLGAVSGLRSQSTVIEPAEIPAMMGIVFHPGGARHFLEEPADDFYNRVVPLDAVWGRRATELSGRLGESDTVESKVRVLETELLRVMQGGAETRPALHSSVRYALQEFRRAPHIRRVIDVGKEAGLSRRRFGQLFREQIGMTPKLYCRLSRFRTVVRQLASNAVVDWADVALAGGYYDQAHLAHEFRDFSGLSPSGYLAAERPSANHVRID
jgi:AraC-like DNA-binding protein